MMPPPSHNLGKKILPARGALGSLWGCGFLFFLFSAAFAQEINPSAQQLFQRAAGSADLQEKARLLKTALRLSPQYAAARIELAKVLIWSLVSDLSTSN